MSYLLVLAQEISCISASLQNQETIVAAKVWRSMIPAKRLRLTHRYCPHCQKECNIKTYKDHKKLFYNPDTVSWYVASTFKDRVTESDSESFNSSLPSDDEENHDKHDSSSESEVENFSSCLDGARDGKCTGSSEDEECLNAPMLDETEEDLEQCAVSHCTSESQFLLSWCN